MLSSYKKTLKRSFLWRTDVRSVLQRCLSFIDPGNSGTPKSQWLWLMINMEPDKRGLPVKPFLSLDNITWGLHDLREEAIQSTEVAFSAVIREYKHSTSFQDDTSLNSLFIHHPFTRVTWLYDKLFLQTIENFRCLCINLPATSKPLVTFLLYAAFLLCT